MDSFFRAILQSWEWRGEIILVLGGAGAIYILGWSQIRRRQRPDHSQRALATFWRLGAYLTGLAALGAALMSPLDSLGGQLFSMHMLQHLVLVMIAPPLLWLANPFLFLLWGTPRPVRSTPRRGVRGSIGRLLNRRARFRQALRWATTPLMALLLFMICLWGWHIPAAYEAALRHDWVHDLEHLTFFVTAMLYWQCVLGAAPHLHRFSRGARLLMLLATVPFNIALGMIIALADKPIYGHYLTVLRLWGVTVMQDQMLSGFIMAAPGSMMYLIAALVLAGQILREV